MQGYNTTATINLSRHTVQRTGTMRWLCIVLCFGIAWGDNATIQYDSPPPGFDYDSMPALADLEDFDLCLKDPKAVYCLADLVLLDDGTPLYEYIMNYSSITYTNYHHHKLFRGVCGSKQCGLNLTHAEDLTAAGSVLKECLNNSIYESYGLQVETLKVRYCKTKGDYVPPDALDYSLGAIILLLLLVNLGCSAYYFLWPGEKGSGNRYVLAFCVQKNWKALKYGGSAEGGIFKCFQALRFYTMVMILGLHSMIFIGYGYTANPEFIEHSYSDFFKALLFNARVIVQIFFVMGGFLMAYKMLTYAETHPFSLKTIPMALINRWLRLMPAVLVVMALAMTWVPHLGSGPMWDAVVKRERDMCRANWWQLVILMPNLFPFEHLCLPQAWYLGTDTQLFLITLVVMLIIWRWPRSGVPVLTSVMAISLIIPFLQSYFMELLPIRVSLFPESIRDIFGSNLTFYHAYVSAQGNWAGYHLGVLTAYFYHRAQTEKWNLGNSLLLKLLFLASVPIAFGAVLMGWDLHHREASALESAVFNALNQNFFALAMCVFIIGYFYRLNKIYVGSVEWGPLQPLGRMSYCAMLLHATVLRTYGGQMRRSFYATDYTAIMLFAGIVCTTYLWALPLYLFVEAPACQLQKILLGPKRKPKMEQEDNNGNQVKPGISTVSVSTVSTHI
ncbi:O-acyltransferase like protein-like [Ostrinia nubilalis]|uniref:O-acyltransferase like protein-like n=1 Tax=Ostrinia nubilalis TaxID=29057 RepID=UPI0030825747